LFSVWFSEMLSVYQFLTSFDDPCDNLSIVIKRRQSPKRNQNSNFLSNDFFV
jgi:hypothetical protein